MASKRRKQLSPGRLQKVLGHKLTREDDGVDVLTVELPGHGERVFRIRRMAPLKDYSVDKADIQMKGAGGYSVVGWDSFYGAEGWVFMVSQGPPENAGNRMLVVSVLEPGNFDDNDSLEFLAEGLVEIFKEEELVGNISSDGPLSRH